MKIAINCSYFTPKGGGIKEYIYNIVSNLNKIDTKNTYIHYILKDQEEYWQEVFGYTLKYKIIPFNKRQRISLALFSRKFWKKEEIIEEFDVFHSPFFHIPYGLSCKTVVTVHDLRFMRFPDSYEKLRLLYLKYIVPKSLKKANHIITISDFTKNEIIHFFNISKEKITTIHEAIDLKRFSIDSLLLTNETSILSKFNIIKDKYLLTVGHIEPRKNYERLIAAYQKLKNKGNFNYKLVIVGKKNMDYENVLKLISENNENILYKNFVNEEELITLYKNAYLFLFPSYYEGFGFPPLEAAALNTPSVVSNVSSIPEICGEGAHYFNPNDINDIANKIHQITNNIDLYDEITNKSFKNLKRFSWSKNAIENIKIYNKLLPIH